MKIHTRTVIDLATSEILEDEFYEYEGPVAEAKGGGGDQTVSNEPPAALQGAYKQYGGAIKGFLDEYNPTFFPGQTYAGQSAPTAEAIEQLSGPSEGIGAATDYHKRVLAGDFMGLSPEMRSAVMDPAMDAASARMTAYGRSGSPASEFLQNKAGMQTLMPYYQAERGRMAEAAKALPILEQAGIDRLRTGGALVEGWDQKAIDEAMQRHAFEEGLPYERYTKMGSLLSPGSQYSVQTTSGDGGSRTAGMLGGALSGAATGSTFGPWGAGIGAGIGLLGGM